VLFKITHPVSSEISGSPFNIPHLPQYILLSNP
jgi:hypothetical protein